MRPQKRYVPTFDPVSVNPDPNRAMMPAAPPIEIEAIGPNTVRLTVGGASRVLDGIAPSNAVNDCLADWRMRQHSRS
jgi:hypothetical protein